MTDDKPLLTREKGAEFLRAHGYPVTLAMLDKAAWAGTGPKPAWRFGKRYLYEQDEMLAWAEGRRRPIATEAAQPTA